MLATAMPPRVWRFAVMTVYVVRTLTPTQLTLAWRVCAQARTLTDRLRLLAQLAWTDVASADVTAVRGWLFEIHRDDAAQIRLTWTSMVPAT
jgi:hypothetical protein